LTEGGASFLINAVVAVHELNSGAARAELVNAVGRRVRSA
jgi:hypothetical protein